MTDDSDDSGTDASYRAAVSAIYDSVLAPPGATGLLGSLRRLFDAQAVALFRTDTRTCTVEVARDAGFGQNAVDVYEQYFHSIDPGYEDVARVRVGAWHQHRSLLAHGIERRAIEREREFVHDFCLANGIRWLAGGKFDSSPRAFGYLTLGRAVGQENFDATHQRLFESIAEHLIRGAKLRTRLSALESDVASFESVLDAVAVPIAIVDDKARIRFANEAARLHFRTVGALQTRSERLEGRDPDFGTWLAGAIRAAARGEGRSTRTRGSDPTMTVFVEVAPVRGAAPGSDATALDRPIVVMFGSAAMPEPRAQRLAALLALTPAEGRLVAALAAGESLEQIAARTRRSIATLRNQLNSISGKTGTRSQGQLIALARCLPGMRGNG